MSDTSRELDARIAYEVLGWNDAREHFPWPESGVILRKDKIGVPPRLLKEDGAALRDLRTVPKYSTDIAAAWKVVEELESRGYDVKYQSRGIGGIPRVTVQRPDESGAIHGAAEEETAAEAFCRAALKAVSD